MTRKCNLKIGSATWVLRETKSEGSDNQRPEVPSQVRAYLSSALSASLPIAAEDEKAPRKATDRIADRVRGPLFWRVRIPK